MLRVTVGQHTGGHGERQQSKGDGRSGYGEEGTLSARPDVRT